MTSAAPKRNGSAAPSIVVLLSWVALAVLAILVLYPITTTVFRAFGGLWSLDAARIGGIADMLGNTAIVVVGASFIALVVASILAWIDERTNARLPLIGEMMPLFPLLLPPVAGVMGWGILLDPNAGFVNVHLRNLLAPLGIEITRGPFDVYSFAGLIGLTGLYLVPYIYLVISSALRRVDPALEEAARISGAGPMMTLIRVTLPAIAPALASALVLCVIAGLGLFSVPFVIGTGARIEVLSVYVFRLLEQYPPQTALALALAFSMMIVVQLLLLAQRYVLKSARHATMGGRGFRAKREDIGPWKLPARLLSLVYVIATVVLPFLALLTVSFQTFWSPNINWSQLTLANYTTAFFESGPASQSLVNSLGLGAITATLVMLVVGAIILFGHFRNAIETRLADIVTAIPATIPHTVIGISFLVAFSLPPLGLQNSLVVLLAAYVVMALPFAGRTAMAAASGVSRELVEAAKVAGASDTRVLLRVLLPLALPGLAAGWTIIFIQTAGEVTASAILSGSQTPVIGRVLMDLWNYGSFPQVAALAIIITIINSVAIALILHLSNRSMSRATR